MAFLKKMIGGLYMIISLAVINWYSYWWGPPKNSNKVIRTIIRHRAIAGGQTAMDKVRELTAERGEEMPTRETVTRHNNTGFWSE